MYKLSSFLLISGIIFISGSVSWAQNNSPANSDIQRGSKAEVNNQKAINAKEQDIANKKAVNTNKQTAQIINRLPGAHIQAQDLAIPKEPAPIKGFHPIKRALLPIERLERNSVQLQQQIMKLEGPIAGLQQPMIGLHKKMDAVQSKMEDIHGQLTTMDGRISRLEPSVARLEQPLANVAGPLTEVKQELQKVEVLIGTVLFTIMVAAVAIAVGTPIAAILVYKNRKKLFPDIPDHEFPVAKSSNQNH